ncbi:MAG TPA: universal stress protein [Acidimicrobiales bacterium]|nr:universal stress protein [Acidimicrobiales bacterium]
MKRIVVGVDGSPGSVAALRWAVGLAQETGAEVDAVSAWWLPTGWTEGAWARDIPKLGAEMFAATAARLDQAVSAATGGTSDPVAVRPCVVEGASAQVLLDASKGADLLVVGSRGRGGFAGLLLGSVSQQCVHHARVPVVVVPTPE